MLGSTAWIWVGCTVPSAPPDPTCDPTPPPEGALDVRVIDCRDLGLIGGEGGIGDVRLANHRFAAVIRAPENSLTLIGAGGGTLIDVAAWDLPDRVHEVAPLVGGGWLDVDGFEVLDDGVAVEGEIVSLPDAVASREGERARATWRLGPDDDGLRIEGNEGLWIHAAGDWSAIGDQLHHVAAGMRHDGILQQDLGGALRVDGAHLLRVGTAAQAATWDDIAISGRAIDASEVVARDAAGAIVAHIPVVADLFDGTVPPTAVTVRAEAGGRAPSPAAAPSDGLDLFVGASGTVSLSFDFGAGQPRAVGLDWIADDGRAGVAQVPAEGGVVGLGAGRHTLVASAGPAFSSRTLTLELEDDELLPLLVQLQPRFLPGARVAARLDVEGDRSRGWRASQLTTARAVHAAGFDYAVFAPRDEVATVNSHLPGWPRLAVRAGSRTTLERGDLWSWPWTADVDQPGHGAVQVRLDDVDAALVQAAGGVGGHRLVAIDAALLDAPPVAWTARPALIVLPAPFAAGPAAWTAWTSWLDAGTLLVPSGPVVWAEVDDPSRIGPVDVEAALWSGRVSAGTGPLLTLAVDGVGPGDVAPEHPFRDPARLVDWTAGAALDLDTVALIGDGGIVLWQTTPVDDDVGGSVALSLDVRWVALVGWSAAGAWAATGPVWVDAP